MLNSAMIAPTRSQSYPSERRPLLVSALGGRRFWNLACWGSWGGGPSHLGTIPGLDHDQGLG